MRRREDRRGKKTRSTAWIDKYGIVHAVPVHSADRQLAMRWLEGKPAKMGYTLPVLRAGAESAKPKARKRRPMGGRVGKAERDRWARAAVVQAFARCEKESERELDRQFEISMRKEP